MSTLSRDNLFDLDFGPFQFLTWLRFYFWMFALSRLGLSCFLDVGDGGLRGRWHSIVSSIFGAFNIKGLGAMF